MSCATFFRCKNITYFHDTFNRPTTKNQVLTLILIKMAEHQHIVHLLHHHKNSLKHKNSHSKKKDASSAVEPKKKEERKKKRKKQLHQCLHICYKRILMHSQKHTNAIMNNLYRPFTTACLQRIIIRNCACGVIKKVWVYGALREKKRWVLQASLHVCMSE